MTDVFLLWHHREKSDGETDDKLVGVYSSRESAESAIGRKLAFPGFSDHPGGFEIGSYRVDLDQWSEGFGVEGDDE